MPTAPNAGTYRAYGPLRLRRKSAIRNHYCRKFAAASTAQAAEAARHLHSVIATRTECTGLIKGLETAVRQSYRDEGADLVNSQLTKRSYTSSSDSFRQFPIDEAKPKISHLIDFVNFQLT